MTFPTTVFGLFIVGTGFTDGDSIVGGGFRLFIVPTANIGNAPLDVIVTYVNQFGDPAETTVVSTSVPANTTAGTHIQVVLNTGDVGVQDVTNVTVVGGTTGDKFNLESWNEGFGKSPFTLKKTDTNIVWNDSEPKKETFHGEQSWVKDEQIIATIVNAIKGGTATDQLFTLDTETLDPLYETEFNKFGLMELVTSETQSNSDKQLKIELSNASVTAIDTNEQSTRFKWKWNGSSYVDVGFFKIDFDFALNRGSLFTFEVLDKDGAVWFSRASNTQGWVTPGTINSYCGQEGSYPASNARDGNTGTEWRHTINELHYIIFDLGSSIPVGGVRVYFKGTGSGWSCNVYASDSATVWGSAIVSGWDISGAAGWKINSFVPVTKRYVKIEIDPYNTDNYLADYMDTQLYLLEHQTLNFKSFAFEMRLRCSTTGTAAGTEYLDIRNIKITRYKSSGSITSDYPVNIPNISAYDELLMLVTKPTGTNVKFQLAFSDDGSIWSDFVGPDGTNATFYDSIGQKITLPVGYIGYYYKWKAILESDGRDTSTFDGLTIWEFLKIFPRKLALEKQLSDYYPAANPQIPRPIPLRLLIPRACPGYQVPPAGGDFIAEPLSGNTISAKTIFILIKGTDVDWITEPLSGRTINRRLIDLIRTWSETVVGQVLSGYIKDQNETIIGGTKVIITSTYSVGLDQMGSVDSATGFYQVFVRNTKYDGRLLIVVLDEKTFDVAYRLYGSPIIIDGTQKVPSPQDLHFWKPDAICGKSIAFVGSLVTY